MSKGLSLFSGGGLITMLLPVLLIGTSLVGGCLYTRSRDAKLEKKGYNRCVLEYRNKYNETIHRQTEDALILQQKKSTKLKNANDGLKEALEAIDFYDPKP